MYTRTTAGRDLFLRNLDSGSERWSQTLEDSQDWGSQAPFSQEQQRSQARGQNPGLMRGSQGMPRGPAHQDCGGNRPSTTPSTDSKDLTLARDIRFGLHTIITVMRELPDQMRDVSGQVLRASQQSEETSRLVKDTSERLQNLVTGLEAKLDLLLENKENLEGLKEAVVQNGEQVASLVKQFGQESAKERKQPKDRTRLEELFESTQKDLRREVRKLRESLQDGESFKNILGCVHSMENNVCKLAEAIKGSFAMLQSECNQHHKSSDLQLEMLSAQTTQGFQQIQASVKNLNDQFACMSRDITHKVQLAVREVLQQSPMTVGGNFISPVQQALSAHRPILPFGEIAHRLQISPVAEVQPQRATMALPPGQSQAPKSRSVATHRVCHSRMANSLTLGAGQKRRMLEDREEAGKGWLEEGRSGEQPRGMPEPKAMICANDLSVQKFANPTNFRNSADLSTQHFTPERVLSLEDSPDRNTLILEYDSSSSGDSPVPGQKACARTRPSDDWIERSVTEIPQPTALNLRPSPGTFLVGGCEKDASEVVHRGQIQESFFPKPEVPPKKDRLQGDAKSCYLVTPISGNSFRMRRFLTPQGDQGLKLKLSRRRKNCTT